MKNKLFLFLSLIVMVSVLIGLTVEDPWGSRTQSTDNQININTPPHVSYGTVVFVDSLNGANDTTALKARGYKPYYRGTGAQGASATWYQGVSTVFAAFNGPATGYVASNYNVVTGTNNIDCWLVMPRLAGGILAGDSLFFYERSATGSTFPDSIRVMYSSNDSVPEGTWTELGRFKTNTTTGWQKHGYRATAPSPNGRFAIRYCVVNGGPSGANSDYIGIDAITIERTGGGPGPMIDPTTVCDYGLLPAYPTGVFGHASAVLGDTLYITGSTSAAAGSTTVQRYAYNTNQYSLGTVLPEPKTGHSLTKCGNALYMFGGSASVTVGGTTCWKYTPAAGWTSIAPLPVALSGHVSVNWGDSVIFVVGGPWSSPTTNIYAYRPASNTWITSTPCLAGRRSSAIAISGNKIIIAAGYNAAFFKNTQIGTIGSNASTITWAAGPDVPLRAGAVGCSRPGATAVNDRFYFITGEVSGGGPTNCDSIYIMNTATNTWLPTILTGRGAKTASNYWAGVTNVALPNGKIKVFITGGLLTFTGSQTAGLFTIQVDPCTVTNIGNTETPVSFDLSQNYPNPFNPVTKINFALPKSGLVTLTVYDVLGKEVATLVNEVKNVGTYTVDFNGSNLSSGVYFYKLSAGDFTSIKRMMLIK